MYAVLPSHCAALLVVYLDELAKAAGVVVVGCFGVPKCLRIRRTDILGQNREQNTKKNILEFIFGSS